MKLSATNTTWLELKSRELKLTPEIIMNTVLDRIRQRDEEPGQGKQSLIEWVDAAGSQASMYAEVLEELRRVGSDIESHGKAVRLYLHLIESNKPSPSSVTAESES
jgi:hypothetical protein